MDTMELVRMYLSQAMRTRSQGSEGCMGAQVSMECELLFSATYYRYLGGVPYLG